MEPTITKMQQLDAKNPGFLAMLDEHLDKRKRPSWIAGKLSSRFLVALTIQDIIDYIGQKWAPKLPRTEPLAEAVPDGARPVLVEFHAQAGIGNQESSGGENITPPKTPKAVQPAEAAAEVGPDGARPSEAAIGNQTSAPVYRLPSTVYPPLPQAPPPESPVLLQSLIPKAKPPKRAVTTLRKRRAAALLELQVSLVEKCLERDAPRFGSLDR